MFNQSSLLTAEICHDNQKQTLQKQLLRNTSHLSYVEEGLTCI